MEPRSGQGRAGAMAFALFAGAFRLLAWINGGAALVLVFFMLGVIGSDVAAPDLQAPLALYLAGFLGACGGLLFGWLAQASLLRQGDTLRPGRRHWPAQALAVLFYVVSALCFCAACWLAAGSAATADASVTTGYTGV
ncbi:hypothetical protein [Achromobacter sp. AONIH1]|uniref:hypothetical protein n=1 Tax=Achromobacter sp. AONIH1 TaxID=1758194 RepID=UPI000CD27F2E|nr:hypothetical protein [Achromobacter sp. AONIH1]AUT47148.1 hypothetical protein C2U31_14805 [Achromobacter sp. AONIH1]